MAAALGTALANLGGLCHGRAEGAADRTRPALTLMITLRRRRLLHARMYGHSHVHKHRHLYVHGHKHTGTHPRTSTRAPTGTHACIDTRTCIGTHRLRPQALVHAQALTHRNSQTQIIHQLLIYLSLCRSVYLVATSITNRFSIRGRCAFYFLINSITHNSSSS